MNRTNVEGNNRSLIINLTGKYKAISKALNFEHFVNPLSLARALSLYEVDSGNGNRRLRKRSSDLGLRSDDGVNNCQ